MKYCSKCGNQMRMSDEFCCMCGTKSTLISPVEQEKDLLMKSRLNELRQNGFRIIRSQLDEFRRKMLSNKKSAMIMGGTVAAVILLLAVVIGVAYNAGTGDASTGGKYGKIEAAFLTGHSWGETEDEGSEIPIPDTVLGYTPRKADNPLTFICSGGKTDPIECYYSENGLYEMICSFSSDDYPYVLDGIVDTLGKGDKNESGYFGKYHYTWRKGDITISTYDMGSGGMNTFVIENARYAPKDENEKFTLDQS